MITGKTAEAWAIAQNYATASEFECEKAATYLWNDQEGPYIGFRGLDSWDEGEARKYLTRQVEGPQE